MSSGSREDYLVNILRLAEENGTVRTSKLATYMNVAPASVTEMLRTLSENGLVKYEKYKGVTLTPEGLAYAQSIRKKHHVVERFLTDVLDLDEDSAHEEACLLEHAISNESTNKMCRILGSKVDDDCASCVNPCDNIAFDNSLLSLEPGQRGTISHLQSDNIDQVKKLLSMGFVPGREVRLESMQNNGPRVVSVGDSIIALDSEFSRIIRLTVKR